MKMAEFMLLPPKAGRCQTCAREHDPALPHDVESIFYQVKFNMEHGRAVTWDDAMAHCSPEVQENWKFALKEVEESRRRKSQ